jgi:hypothetical protein
MISPDYVIHVVAYAKNRREEDQGNQTLLLTLAAAAICIAA